MGWGSIVFCDLVELAPRLQAGNDPGAGCVERGSRLVQVEVCESAGIRRIADTIFRPRRAGLTGLLLVAPP